MNLNRLQLTVIAAGVGAGLAFALVGATLAADSEAMPPLQKGDRIAEQVSEVPMVTVEEVNLDTRTSNLILIHRETASP